MFNVSLPRDVLVLKLLGLCNETHLMLLEHAQHAGEVQQRSAQPVDFIHHDTIQLAASTAWSSLVRTGRSMLAQVKPPSSYNSGNAIHPSRR